MIYQEMYGYIALEDPQEQKKSWASLTPQVRDYINVFVSYMNQADENVFYENSKFYRLITEEQFENLCQLFIAKRSKDILIDLAFEQELKEAFVAYENKVRMKAKMNRWRKEMEEKEQVLENTEVKASRQQRIESDSLLDPKRMNVPHSAENSSKFSTGWLVVLLILALILLTIYFIWK